ncbi:MAG: enoyl-CoA hydratase/isomerase family protein [SAR202 cluster bacterium]|jgi:enoyl-CoA hydratase/carnithine racemase|nr:MAG: enoyl-CoA hydratase/isomerase family protein [SAR202 cluster bacterium]MCH2526112.1 enoyl-CoA hydratase/isomerase family protein [Dehalococcoidia bacterium]MCH2527839.1 enoyl-CoA hydratase/isomerase family protein [Dehalococcoidia bacterium]MQG81380.1 enoyl-CoA hydratase/isomerase family protein [SAR202 cluster bacterium]
MSMVNTDIQGQTMLIQLNRPERLNALGFQLRTEMAEAFTEFRDNRDLEVCVFTGTGRAFCAGEDMKESLERGTPGGASKPVENPFWDYGTIDKPIIAAVNGYAMGGGFMLVERTDLRVAVPEAVFEVSEAKRWLLGGYNHGFFAGLPHAVATEMALGFRFTAQRMYELGFINRLVESDELLPTAFGMADHLLSLPPASRMNTMYMMRQMRSKVSPDLSNLAAALHDHGDKEDLMESRRAFAEKRKPNFNGWVNPEDRYNMPRMETLSNNS